MARQKKVNLTPEEELELERQRELKTIDTEYHFLHVPDPSYTFNVGDNVKYGGLISSVVEQVLNDGKAYLLRCVARDNKYGNPIDYTTYRAVCWHQIRPLTNNVSNFSQKENIHLYFNNCTIESLLHYYYHFGIDVEPDYQRGYVWEQEDKEKLIASIFDNVDIGKFVLVHLNTKEWIERDVSYEILDGKQRLSTLIDFYENRFPYKDKYYNDLDFSDRHVFLNHQISMAKIENADKKTVYTQFLRLNRTGRQMSSEHLEKVEKLLSEI